MNYICDQPTEKIFQHNFAFYGLLSSDGFLLNLKGEIFNESHIEPELLVGHKFTETVFWQSAPQTPDLVQTAIENAAHGVSSKTELEFRVNAQRNLFVTLNLTPCPDASGSINEIFFSAVDATEAEYKILQYKQQSEYLSNAAAAGDVGLWFWDFETGENFSTPKCAALFNLTDNEPFSYDSFVKSVHPEDAERVLEEVNRAQAEEREFNVEYRAVGADSEIQWLSLKGKSFYDAEKNPIGMTGAARRVTDRKLAIDEFAKINENVLKARDEAQEANRAKDYFLAFVSHELRSPLNSILGWAKILLTKDVDAETRRSALETIERSAKSQSKLIDDLVDSARVTSGKLKLEMRPVNLYQLTKDVFNSQKPAAAAKQISLTFDSDTETAETFGDAIRLQQVFSNLLTNALKFTPENGRVSIKFTASDAQSASVIVEDNGQGIAPDFLPVIFKQYAQADEHSSRDRSGLGLGLAIVKTLIEKHGGSISASSEGLGRGAKFVVTLPRLDSSARQETSIEEPVKFGSADQDSPLKNVKILILEDDQDSREVLQLFLEQNGAFVESAESVAEAWKILTESSNDTFDVIVSDLAMPVEDGYSFIRRVRGLNQEILKQIPALALSAFASPENRERATAAGFQLYHTKPFEPNGIVGDILSLIKNKSCSPQSSE